MLAVRKQLRLQTCSNPDALLRLWTALLCRVRCMQECSSHDILSLGRHLNDFYLVTKNFKIEANFGRS